MKIMVSKIALVGLLVTAHAVPAVARDFVGYPSTTPLLYVYASCVFGSSESTAEAQIASCAQVKNRIDEESDQVIARFHRSGRADVRREFRKGIREIENDAQAIRDQRKEVPAIIVAYLGCMGSSVMETDDYKLGVAVDYIGVESSCFDRTISGGQELTSVQLDNVAILYRRFHLSGRFSPSQSMETVRQRSRSFQRAPERQLFDRSFLNPSLMKAEPND